MKKLLYFTAQWCGPCRMMAPMISELSQQYSIDKIDIDSDPDMTERFNVRSIPTFVVLQDGVEVRRSIGAQDKSKLIKLLS